MVHGSALKIQLVYIVADTSNAGGILTCVVVAMTEFARFLSMVVVSLMIFTSKCSSILVSLGRRTVSCGSTSMVEVGSSVITLAPDCHVLSLGSLVLPMVGSCVATLGPVIFVVGCVTGNKDIDIDDEEILVTSIFRPLPLSLGAGSCVATF